MPQFETERAGEAPQILRALTPEDAVRRAFEVAPEAPVAIGDPDLRDAWADVRVDGALAGRVRPHARMRFRRD